MRGHRRGDHDGVDALVGEDFAVVANGVKVGDVRSQVWSPRYRRYLAMVMMRRDYLADHERVTHAGASARIVGLPFDFAAIT